MFLDLTKKFGKPICVLLYGVFGWLAGKKKPLPLLILLGLHLSEYFLVGRKVAEEAGLEKSEGFFPVPGLRLHLVAADPEKLKRMRQRILFSFSVSSFSGRIRSVVALPKN